MPLLSVLLLAACTSDIILSEDSGKGCLRLSLPSISTITRSTPSELGAPAATAFNVRVVNAFGRAVYDAAFSDTELTVLTGEYTIFASYGTNPIIGFDSPYYIGTATAIVEEDQTTTVNVPVSIGNALVSVHFGRDDVENARFHRFYSAYAVRVTVGNNSAFITNDDELRSVYLRAGSTVSLSFEGTLASGGRQVSMPITLPNDVSATLEAADHLNLTLTLEDSEDGAIINVQKAEVTKVTVEETIPYEWLPAPTVSYTHQYNAEGELVGTDLSVTPSFPDLTWTTQIHQGSATGNVVRTLTGMGALAQSYTADASWPFLPAGTYVATFTYTSEQGQVYDFTKMRTFTVEQPNLTLSVDGYTAHTKYEEGDVAAANSCERLTFYAPSAKWNVSNSLLANGNYTRTYARTFNNQTTTESAGTNSPVWADVKDVPVSGSLYTFSVTATFCGQATTATKQVRITGLPADFSPPTQDTGWSNDKGTTDFESTYVRLGNFSWSQPHRIKNASWFNIPSGVKLALDYDIALHRAAVNTTANVKAGDQQIVEVTNSSYGEDIHNTGIATITTSAIVTDVTCEGSYGSGATHTKVYKLHFIYGQ